MVSEACPWVAYGLNSISFLVEKGLIRKGNSKLQVVAGSNFRIWEGATEHPDLNHSILPICKFLGKL